MDLQQLTGSGPGGRIVKADVEARRRRRRRRSRRRSAAIPLQRAARPPSGAACTAKGETTTSSCRARSSTIARRMAESKATIPDFTLTADVDMEECVALRAELKRLATGASAAHATYNDMVVKACALALREHPRANGSYRDGRFELHSRVNVGVAVAVDSDDPTAGALVVPTVFDADTKSLGEIARETRALAERVRDGTITPPELGGGTFTVSNLGMFGVAQLHRDRQPAAGGDPRRSAQLAAARGRPRRRDRRAPAR